VKTATDDECKDAKIDDAEKFELNEQIIKLKEKCEKLVEEKESLESEMKNKSVSNEDIQAVGFINIKHEIEAIETRVQ
jgi:hypothetical protein